MPRLSPLSLSLPYERLARLLRLTRTLAFSLEPYRRIYFALRDHGHIMYSGWYPHGWKSKIIWCHARLFGWEYPPCVRPKHQVHTCLVLLKPCLYTYVECHYTYTNKGLQYTVKPEGGRRLNKIWSRIQWKGSKAFFAQTHMQTLHTSCTHMNFLLHPNLHKKLSKMAQAMWKQWYYCSSSKITLKMKIVKSNILASIAYQLANDIEPAKTHNGFKPRWSKKFLRDW
jgi:hypothetical protein